MKKLVLVSFGFMLMLSLVAQAPDYFNYQAMLRNPDGTPMINEEVSLQVDLLQGTIDGTSIYLENHSTDTDDLGLVNLKIGDGTFFNEIDWEEGPYFLSISVNGSHLGASQLLSVPYALYAKKTGNVDDDDPDPTNELQTLSINEMNLEISGGNTITLPDVVTPWQTNYNGIHYMQNVGIGVDARLPEVMLDIRKNVSGEQDRALIRLRNTDEGPKGYVGLALETYEDIIAKTFYRSELFLTSEYFTEIPDFKGMCAVRAPGSGFSIFTESDYGSIRFYTTTVQDTIMERARFDPAGNLGIGTTAPKTKVHVADGDIYIEDISRGVIMQSPDGTHWRVTVNDGGTLDVNSVTMK